MSKFLITPKHLLESYKSLIKRSRLDLDFLLLIASAAALCSFGFRMNSSSVIVGSMVTSPLLYSVISIGVTFFKKDWRNFSKKLLTMVIGMLVAVGVALFINLFLHTKPKSEIIDRLRNTPLDYFIVASISGFAATFSFFWPEILEAIVGIAISVALIPPATLVGLGLARLDSPLIVSSVLITLYNIVGIFLGSLIAIAGVHCIAKRNHTM